MTVRATEKNIPSGYVASDLGEVKSSGDSQMHLISFQSSPIVNNRQQAYVVFVLEEAIAAQVEEYFWTFDIDGAATNQTTTVGYVDYTPTSEGSLTVTVVLKDNAAAVLGTLVLEQDVSASNAELESLISQLEDSAPLAGSPDVSREVINDFRIYIDNLSPRDEDENASMNRLLFGISYAEAMKRPVDKRNLALEKIADAFDNSTPSVFADEGEVGIGVCRIRPHVLGMYLPVTPGGTDWYLTPLEIGDTVDSVEITKEILITALKALTAEKNIDLFNLLRFPKSNIKMAREVLNILYIQYFPAEDLETMILDKKKTKELIDQFKEGPNKQ